MRSHIIDSRVVPIENLATNPSFERVVPGTTIVRKNLAHRPIANTMNALPVGQIGVRGSRWFGASNTGTHEAKLDMSDGPIGIRSYVRKTWVSINGSGFTNDTGFELSNSAQGSTPVIPGQTYTISAYLRPSVAKNGNIDIYTFNSAGTALGRRNNNGVAATQFLPSNQWTRLSYTWTVPVGVSYAYWVTDINTIATNGAEAWVAGSYLDITAICVELAPAVLPFFCGDTTDNSGIAYSWEGAAHGSASIAKASATELRRNYAIDPGATAPSSLDGPRIAVDRWPADGTYSLITPSDSPVGTTSAIQYEITAARVSGHGFHLAGNPEGTGISTARMLPVVAGEYVTISLYVKKIGTATSMNVRIRGTNGTGWVSQVVSSAVPVSSTAWTRISATYLVPNTVTYVSAYTTGGADAIGDLWQATGLLIEKSPAVGSYFSGSITLDAELVPSWNGTENASTSVLYGLSANGFASSGRSGVGTRTHRLLSEGSILLDGTASSASVAEYQLYSGPIASLPVIPGRTYTAIARVRITAAGSSPAGRDRRINAYNSEDGGVTFTQTSGDQCPNAAGTYEIRVTYTVSKNANYHVLRIGGNELINRPGSHVWIEHFALIEGVYTGPYIDGDTRGSMWRGTPHNSKSIGYPPIL